MKSHPFSDFRHGQRLRETVRLLAEQPEASVPQASGSASKSQSMYRFWTNERVQPTQILASHRGSVVERANAAAVVLAIQDTTDLNISSQQLSKRLCWDSRRLHSSASRNGRRGVRP
ncbi:hypothetical protein K9N68_18195 [Kovacikia minuta CCNUW1]|uniref:transposase DNA-binding-containing protein n=1 Tax=Kovacikia minuta TaxID=2931930 RepID=UPI001CCC9F85|nr:transposase DNA-binding-containing protein [Kovacikia minuta]UBF29596.1 hypothetical protein K9N68_18195 [Kovacikia minuta CCNUW1]